MTIAFDVDGTLITFAEEPRWEVIQMVRILSKNNKIIIWSGAGKAYAEEWMERLFLNKYIKSCERKPFPDEGINKNIDLCFDDEEVKLAKFNIKI